MTENIFISSEPLEKFLENTFLEKPQRERGRQMTSDNTPFPEAFLGLIYLQPMLLSYKNQSTDY